MKNFKRIASLTLATTLCFSLAACGDKKEIPETDTTPVVDATEVGKEVGEAVNTIIDDIKETVAEPEPGPAPTTPEDTNISLTNIFENVKNAFGETFLAGMELDKETFNSIVGLDDTMYTEFIAFQAPMSAHVDRFFVVKTEDTATVEAKFNEYKTSLVNDTMQYPSNIEKIAGSVVEVRGDYVFFYILGGYPANVEDTENAEIMKEFVKEANSKVETVLNSLFN